MGITAFAATEKIDGSGAMLTGWQFINGAWYYLDSSGAMYADQTTPDGYYVDGSGEGMKKSL